MAYNISEISGNSVGSGNFSVGEWTFDVRKSEGSVNGDFNEDPIFGTVGGEAAGGYVFSPLSTDAFGTLTSDSVTGEFTFVFDKSAIAGTGGVSVSFTVTGTDDEGETDTDTVTINIAICVQRGTIIETKNGLVAVEDLQIGDEILTLDSGCKPIKWIGSREIDSAGLQIAPDMRPIRISKGALGENRPSQDLLVSPQHRVLVGGAVAELYFGASEVLVPAKSLVNDTNIRVAHEVTDVEYFHVLFDQHEIMMTNGTPTESFFPGDYTLDKLDRAVLQELRTVFPELIKNPDSFGPAARLSVKPWEAAILSKANLSNFRFDIY